MRSDDLSITLPGEAEGLFAIVTQGVRQRGLHVSGWGGEQALLWAGHPGMVNVRTERERAP